MGRKLAILTALFGIGALSLGVGIYMAKPDMKAADLPELIEVPAGPYRYRPSGDFRIGTRVVDAPLETRVADTPLEIMKYAVSQADYAICVADHACLPTSVNAGADVPQIDVNYTDAQAYAAWLSRKSGQTWRLPTDDEWVRAAADRYVDDALGGEANGDDPSKRWIANYRRLVAERGNADLEIHPRGGFGENELGVSDIAGNVWEWTTSCFQNAQVSEDGLTVLESTDYCGVRAVQGKHRAFIIDFVRDAKVGGCAVGIPPDYLGFRLVRSAT